LEVVYTYRGGRKGSVRHPLVGPVTAVDLYRHTMPVLQPPHAATFTVFEVGDVYYAANGRTGEVEYDSEVLREVLQYALDNLPKLKNIPTRGGTVLLAIGHGYLDGSVDVSPSGSPRMPTIRGMHSLHTQLRPTGNFPAFKIEYAAWGVHFMDLGIWIDEALMPTYTAFLIDSDVAEFCRLTGLCMGRGNLIRLRGGHNMVYGNIFEWGGDCVVLQGRDDAGSMNNHVFHNAFFTRDGKYGVTVRPSAAYPSYDAIVSHNRFVMAAGNPDARGVLLDGDGTVRCNISHNTFAFLSEGVTETAGADYNWVRGNRFYTVTTPVTLVGVNSRSEGNWL